MTLLQDITSNNIQILHLSNDPEYYFYKTSEFISALACNTSIETVILDKDFLSCFVGSDRKRVLDAIAELPTLQHVHLADVCILISVLTEFIHIAEGSIQSLTMERMVLQGIQSDFEEFESTLLLFHQKLMTLKQFKMKDCTTANKDINMDKINNISKKTCMITKSTTSHTASSSSCSTPLSQVKNNAIAA